MGLGGCPMYVSLIMYRTSLSVENLARSLEVQEFGVAVYIHHYLGSPFGLFPCFAVCQSLSMETLGMEMR